MVEGELLENAPEDRKEREAYERDVQDRCRRTSVGYMLLDPKLDDDAQLTLQLARSERITGIVRLDGKPLAKAYVSIFSRSTPIDGLFARTSPELTNAEGRIDYYSVRGDLDRCRIVIEGEKENRVLTLNDIQWKPTEGGREFEFATNSSDYTTVSGAAAKHAN